MKRHRRRSQQGSLPTLLVTSLMLAASSGALAQGAGRGGNPLDNLPPVPQRAIPEAPAQAALPNPGAAVPAGQQITPRRFDIEGVKSIPFAEVAQLFAPLTGKTVAAAELVDKAAQATLMYRKAGYALGFFYVPAQDFANGVVRIVAVEGHVGSLKIEGDAGRSEAQLRALAAPILAEKPLTQPTFERYTALLARLPGLAVTASVPAPTSTDGASVMTLAVKRSPYAVSVGAAVGEPHSRLVVTGELNDVITPGGQLSASTLIFPPAQEKFYSAAYTQAIGSEGLVLKLSSSYYRADPDASLGVEPGPLGRLTTQRRTELSASYPLILSASRSLTLSGGLYGVNNADAYTNRTTAERLVDDTRTRAAFVQLAYAAAEPGMERSASAMLVQGIDGLGARAELVSDVPGLGGPSGTQLKFTRLLLQGSQAMRFGNQIGVAAAFAAQYSGDSLPASERISFGGLRFGRGYASGETSGDSGFGFSMEVNRRFTLPTGRPLWLEPYLMAESGRVRASGGALAPVPAQLVSLTLGARLTDQKYYSVDLGVSKAVGDAPLENPERKLRTNLILNYRLDQL